MLTEMGGKSGNLCLHAKSGEIRCPLIVRPTSEDVITGHIFQSLGYLDPRWWLPDLLNVGLGANRFRRQIFRNFRIRLWQNQPCYPRELLPWEEGSSQIDAVITWENPPTTVFIEAKYGSGLSEFVSGDDGSSGYPSDQLIRDVRVGLFQSGYFDLGGQLFQETIQDFIVLVLSPTKGHPLVDRYRDASTLKRSIPHADRLVGLPFGPFIGQVDYGDIRTVLEDQTRYLSPPERRVAADLTQYLEYKRSTRPNRSHRKSPRPEEMKATDALKLPSDEIEILTVG